MSGKEIITELTLFDLHNIAVVYVDVKSGRKIISRGWKVNPWIPGFHDHLDESSRVVNRIYQAKADELSKSVSELTADEELAVEQKLVTAGLEQLASIKFCSGVGRGTHVPIIDRAVYPIPIAGIEHALNLAMTYYENQDGIYVRRKAVIVSSSNTYQSREIARYLLGDSRYEKAIEDEDLAIINFVYPDSAINCPWDIDFRPFIKYGGKEGKAYSKSDKEAWELVLRVAGLGEKNTRLAAIFEDQPTKSVRAEEAAKELVEKNINVYRNIKHYERVLQFKGRAIE
ncbi:MAG: hypothetical protein ABIG89_03900 [Candidatus Woesearchaeota archaeon]